MADDGLPYPTFQELRCNFERVSFTNVANRLYWPLEGTSPSAISVMKALRRAAGLEPFFLPDTKDGGQGTWHEVAQQPMTDPKDWVAWHEYHDTAEWVTYGDLSDDEQPYAKEAGEDGNWEEDSDTAYLAACCDEDRPVDKRGTKLDVKPSAGNNFVTVHDYISAVHPWLMSLRDDILQSKIVVRPGPIIAMLDGTEWMVAGSMPDHEIMLRETWLQINSPTRPMDAATARFLQNIGRSKKLTERWRYTYVAGLGKSGREVDFTVQGPNPK